jgi:hypothetical protein
MNKSCSTCAHRKCKQFHNLDGWFTAWICGLTGAAFPKKNVCDRWEE